MSSADFVKEMSATPTFTFRRRGMSGPVAAVTVAVYLFFLVLGGRWVFLLLPLLCIYLLISLLRITLARQRPLAIEGGVLVRRDASGREIGRVSLDTSRRCIGSLKMELC